MANGIPNELLEQLAFGGGVSPLVGLGATIASLGGPVGSRVAENLRFQQARSMNAFRNMALLESMKSSKQRRGLVDELTGILGETPQPLGEAAQLAAAEEGQALPATVPGTNLPGNQARLPGILAALAPEAFVNAQMGGQRAETSLIRNMRALGIDPGTPEGQALGLELLKGGDANQQLARAQALNAQLEVQRRQQELTEKQKVSAEAEKLKQQDIKSQSEAVKTDVNRGLELSNLLDELEGTLLQTGQGFDIRLAGIGAAGLAKDEQRRLAAKGRRFKQLSTNFGVRMLEVLKGTGTISNAKFQTLVQNTVSAGAEPEANRQALADIFEVTLQAADKLDLSLSQRKEIEDAIPRLRGGQSTEFSQEDLEFTAKKHNITVDEVKKRLGVK